MIPFLKIKFIPYTHILHPVAYVMYFYNIYCQMWNNNLRTDVDMSDLAFPVLSKP